MKKNPICELLGIKYPVIQGGMAWIADAELAAAVSNAKPSFTKLTAKSLSTTPWKSEGK